MKCPVPIGDFFTMFGSDDFKSVTFRAFLIQLIKINPGPVHDWRALAPGINVLRLITFFFSSGLFS
jgi:hypothetical protein